MKNLILALPLLFVTPSCETVGALLDVPSAIVEDGKDAVDLITPGEKAIAATAGQAAGSATTVATGSPALGAAIGAAVTAAAAWLFSKRRKPVPTA